MAKENATEQEIQQEIEKFDQQYNFYKKKQSIHIFFSDCFSVHHFKVFF